MSVEAAEVFISYAHGDYKVVMDIVTHLKQKGCEVWFDEEGIKGGDDWQDRMEKGINSSRSCAAFIGDREPEGWHMAEIRLSLNRSFNDKKKAFVVIPVLLDTPNYENVKVYLFNSFLGLNSVIIFKDPDPLWPLYRLLCAIKREKADLKKFRDGNWPGLPEVKKEVEQEIDPLQQQLESIKRLKDADIIDEETFNKLVSKVLGRPFDYNFNRATPHAS